MVQLPATLTCRLRGVTSMDVDVNVDSVEACLFGWCGLLCHVMLQSPRSSGPAHLNDLRTQQKSTLSHHPSPGLLSLPATLTCRLPSSLTFLTLASNRNNKHKQEQKGMTFALAWLHEGVESSSCRSDLPVTQLAFGWTQGLNKSLRHYSTYHLCQDSFMLPAGFPAHSCDH